jgi:hypothetical protein
MLVLPVLLFNLIYTPAEIKVSTESIELAQKKPAKRRGVGRREILS